MGDEKLGVQVKANIAMWIVGTLLTLLFGLVGVVYSNLNTKVDQKADIDMVTQMDKRLDHIEKGVDKLLDMHINNKGR